MRKRLFDDTAEQQNFKLNVKKCLKNMEMNYVEFTKKINFPYKTFVFKMSCGLNRRFNVREMIWISNELGEYIEDLCQEPKK